MIRDQVIRNESVQPNSKEIATLKAKFPQFFDKSGQFLQDRFNEMLDSSDILLNKEGYELKFLGKSYARYLSSTATETFITPIEKENNKKENKDSENIYIIGDNIDALKHLINSYSGLIKCIYIDPPYNTGKDGFVYPDNFSFNSKELSEVIGIEEEEATRILNLAGKSSHSAWLTFMYPRLIPARELLREDGVIFISIDDFEFNNLKIGIDEIFGEENAVETLIWKRRATPPNDRIIGRNHEYVLIYAKNIDKHKINLQKRTAEVNKSYINRDDDPRGAWDYADLSGNGKGGRLVQSCIYPILDPITGQEHYPPNNKCWLYNKEKMHELMEDNRIVFRGRNRTPYQKKFLTDVRNGITLPTYIEDEFVDYSIDISDVGTSQNSSKEIKDLFGNDVFEFPKPINLIKKLLVTGCEKDSIVLDFFSGSATTADAVMKLNAEDGGNRKYIMVQLSELINEKKAAYKEGFRTIDEIGRERIRRAAKQIKEETHADIDYGFKTFKLEPVNQNTLNKMISFDPSKSFLTEDMISIFDTEYSSGLDSILTTWLNEDGYGLTAKTEEYPLKDYSTFLYNDSLYIIKEGFNSDEVMELIKKLETFELNIQRIIVYPYSVKFSVMHELKKNIKNLRNSKSVEVIERY